MTTQFARSGINLVDADLPTLAYDHLHDPDQAHAAIAAARRQASIAIGPHGPEILSYELVRTVLRDPRFVSATGLSLDVQGITAGPLRDRAARNILGLDGAEHHRLRRLVSKAFAPRGAERLRDVVVDTISDLVERFTRIGHCDVVTDIARRYPTPIICALLGAPREDWPLISDWTDQIKKLFEWNLAADGDAIEAAWDELDDYLENMVEQRRHELTDDLISDLIHAEDDGDRLAHSELLMLAAALLVAGTDTTRNQLAAAVHALADHPDQWALIGEHPELAASAVNEVMRYYPVVLATIRQAAETVELDGIVIPAGTLVVANTAAANRDEEVYDDPHRLDVTRTQSPPMLTFGGGVHYCLGAHLARVELVEALRLMTRRMPDPVAVAPARWNVMSGITGPAELRIAFARGH